MAGLPPRLAQRLGAARTSHFSPAARGHTENHCFKVPPTRERASHQVNLSSRRLFQMEGPSNTLDQQPKQSRFGVLATQTPNGKMSSVTHSSQETGACSLPSSWECPLCAKMLPGN